MHPNHPNEAPCGPDSTGHQAGATSDNAPMPEIVAAQRKMGVGQRIVIVILLTVVIVPPSAAFYSYFTGVPLHLLAPSAKAEEPEGPAAKTLPRISLATSKPHTLNVPDE